MTDHQPITLLVNGVSYDVAAPPATPLLRVLRDTLQLSGTKEGCDDCECGACMVLVDGGPVNSCSYLLGQVAGRTVTTVEGLTNSDGSLGKLQEAFVACGGIQCGFCTPGMLISATALIEENSEPSRADIQTALSGNLCRCTGYQKILDAVEAALE